MLHRRANALGNSQGHIMRLRESNARINELLKLFSIVVSFYRDINLMFSFSYSCKYRQYALNISIDFNMI